MNKHFELLDKIFDENTPLSQEMFEKMIKGLKDLGLSEEEAMGVHLAWLERNEIIWRKNQQLNK